MMSSNEIVGICQLGFGQGHMGRSGRGQGYCSGGGEVHRKGWLGFGQGHMGRSGRGQGYCSGGGEVHRKGWEEEKQIEDDQAANARYWKIPACYDDDDGDYAFAITPNEPVNSLNMGDEHLDTILATKSDKFI
nr:hypothetical protein [Tanacetum cinerariifolium]GFA31385.1 hypothetical protein [Tanacetum cinerariifolium]